MEQTFNCPYCGKIIIKDFLNENSERPKVTCPDVAARGIVRTAKDKLEAGKFSATCAMNAGTGFHETGGI